VAVSNTAAEELPNRDADFDALNEDIDGGDDDFWFNGVGDQNGAAGGDGDDAGGSESAGGDEQFANGAYAQSARPWLNGTVVIEQGPWLVNFDSPAPAGADPHLSQNAPGIVHLRCVSAGQGQFPHDFFDLDK
jgi:hypothetical protein